MLSFAAVLHLPFVFRFGAQRAPKRNTDEMMSTMLPAPLSMSKLRPEVPPEPVEGLAEGGRLEDVCGRHCVTRVITPNDLHERKLDAKMLAQRRLEGQIIRQNLRSALAARGNDELKIAQRDPAIRRGQRADALASEARRRRSLMVVAHIGVLALRVWLEREAILRSPAVSIALHQGQVIAIAIDAVGATILLLLGGFDKAQRIAKRIAKANIGQPACRLQIVDCRLHVGLRRSLFVVRRKLMVDSRWSVVGGHEQRQVIELRAEAAVGVRHAS